MPAENQIVSILKEANAEWSMDFMSDTLYHGRRLRTLNILDEGVREVLDIVIDTSIPGGRNEERPHDSLGKIPPAMFRRQTETARNSTSELCH